MTIQTKQQDSAYAAARRANNGGKVNKTQANVQAGTEMVSRVGFNPFEMTAAERQAALVAQGAESEARHAAKIRKIAEELASTTRLDAIFHGDVLTRATGESRADHIKHVVKAVKSLIDGSYVMRDDLVWYPRNISPLQYAHFVANGQGIDVLAYADTLRISDADVESAMLFDAMGEKEQQQEGDNQKNNKARQIVAMRRHFPESLDVYTSFTNMVKASQAVVKAQAAYDAAPSDKTLKSLNTRRDALKGTQLDAANTWRSSQGLSSVSDAQDAIQAIAEQAKGIASIADVADRIANVDTNGGLRKLVNVDVPALVDNGANVVAPDATPKAKAQAKRSHKPATSGKGK